MSEQTKHPLIGVGAMIQKEDGCLLLGLRKGAHGSGEWCFPGGHLDFGETIFETAVREAWEETGLNVRPIKIISVSDDFRYINSHGKHYVTIGVQAEYLGGEPQILEPDRCLEWSWFNLNNLPEPLFEGTKWILHNYSSGKIYEPALVKARN